MRSAIERRQEILERLSVRRVDTIGNLMVEFGVSRSTIKRDLEIIGLSAPIYTVKGKGGGVRVMNGYDYGRRDLKPDQVDLLEKLIPELYFDWGGDGIADHVGIVESCDGSTVYTIEGNANDAVKRLSYSIGSTKIMGYGTT